MRRQGAHAEHMPFSPSRLRGHREGQRLEIQQLADLSGLSHARIHEIESSTTAQPTLYEEKCLWQALGLDQPDLRVQRPTPWADYCHAVLSYAPRLTPGDIESVASVIRQIRARRRAELDAEGAA